jgi:carbamoyl-phosphate synthase/aspartate carbamoyltransferase/dihydroorotase
LRVLRRKTMTTIMLPGLIDPHVHLREPGAIHKEDYDTGTAAALAGGFTCVLDMPNNTPPVTDAATLAAKQAVARAKARCDYGIHLGAGADNIETAASLALQVTGLKMYLDQTFGSLRLDDLGALMAHAERWPRGRPLLCHAEGRTIAAAIMVAHLSGARVHICHVSRRDEMELIRRAKDKGIDVTCEAAPHHLFLTEDDAAAIGAGRSEVRPRLARKGDRAALRAHLEAIDCFATDHAPHTLVEKDSPKPPPGFPGLETALALYLELVRQNLISVEGLIERSVRNPRRIFDLPDQPDTWIEVDPDEEWVARGTRMHTRAGWTPFEGWTMRGRVQRVVLRGVQVYYDGTVLAAPGFGRDVRA